MSLILGESTQTQTGFGLGVLTGVEVDSYLLGVYEIEAWFIYCRIQHCVPRVMGCR